MDKPKIVDVQPMTDGSRTSELVHATNRQVGVAWPVEGRPAGDTTQQRLSSGSTTEPYDNDLVNALTVIDLRLQLLARSANQPQHDLIGRSRQALRGTFDTAADRLQLRHSSALDLDEPAAQVSHRRHDGSPLLDADT